MDDTKINDEDIDQQYQVIIRKCPEPSAYPKPPHRFYSKRLILFKYPDQHPSDQETAKYEEQFHTIDQLNPGEGSAGFFKHQSMLKHHEDDGKGTHDVEAKNPGMLIGMQEKNIPHLADEVNSDLHLMG